MPQHGASRDEFDGPWKEALARYFKDALELLAPEIHGLIDWRHEVVFLDKELQRFLPETGDGRRHVDKLARVHAQKGGEALLLVHVEVQADPDVNLPERMYRYSYRSFDAFNLPVESVAILADTNHRWRPDHYEQQALCSRIRLDFTAIKLLDREDRREELERSHNPFAVFVMAHLMAKRVLAGEERVYWKTALVRSLFRRGLSGADIGNLFHLVDWILKLPPELDRSFRDDLRRIEEERNVEHMNTIERLARAEAQRDSIVKVLTARFGPVPADIAVTLEPIDDLDILDHLTGSAAVAEDLATFAQTLAAATRR